MLFRNKRARPDDVCVTHAPDACVYMLHYVEHDCVIHVHAPSIEHACACARTHMHTFTSRPDVYTRPLLYNDDRIAIILYGNDHEYTCNIVRMPVYTHDRVPDDAFDRDVLI